MAKNEEQSQSSPGAEQVIRVFYALVVLVLGACISWFVYSTTIQSDSEYPFKLGLDLAGGSQLVYEADVTEIDPGEVSELMNVLRDVIERRVNVFGVSEPLVQVEQSSFVSGEQKERLVVELPGVTDVEEAVAEIGKTPLLEFKLVNEDAAQSTSTGTSTISDDNELFIDTGLTGRYLESAQLAFINASNNPGTVGNEPIVSIRFNGEGGDLFAEITREHVGESLAIFLDGELLSAPRINEAILGGQATISGGFTTDEARSLAENLNFGALPVPITLVSTQSVGASLGAEVLEHGIEAGLYGIGLVMLFLILWYRLPGVVAGIALMVYIAVMLALFKLIPVTLTAAGLAGFILSIGMAVDANVLVFERFKEEYRSGKTSRTAAKEGFARAWSAIRDGNITSLLSAIILFWFGTSIVKGFALVFGMGVIVSMLSALVVTRTLLVALPDVKGENKTFLSRLFMVGLRSSVTRHND